MFNSSPKESCHKAQTSTIFTIVSSPYFLLLQNPEVFLSFFSFHPTINRDSRMVIRGKRGENCRGSNLLHAEKWSEREEKMGENRSSVTASPPGGPPVPPAHPLGGLHPHRGTPGRVHVLLLLAEGLLDLIRAFSSS